MRALLARSPAPLKLLLGYVHDSTGKQPSSLDWEDLDEPLIAHGPRSPSFRSRIAKGSEGFLEDGSP